MGELKQLYHSTVGQDDRMTLYDRYGALAYGIILKIIPEPVLAQRVLVDLFSSTHLKEYARQSSPVSSEIIRLARQKALEAKPFTAGKPVPLSSAPVNDTSDKFVFELSFYRGFTIDEIANKMQLPRSGVLEKICSYFKHHRLS